MNTKRNEIGEIYSNFDHEMDTDVVDKLKTTPNSYAQHSAVNFCGYVYWDDTNWVEEVWVYHNLDNTYTNEDLEELIKIVNDKYGRK